MRYASERLSLFRTVFVQVAALLLFAAGGMLLAVAERELNVRPTHHAEMAPAELPAPAEKSFQKKTRGSQPPFALSGLSPMLQPERPVRLSEAVSALLPSWRGLVAFPQPPPASAKRTGNGLSSPLGGRSLHAPCFPMSIPVRMYRSARRAFPQSLRLSALVPSPQAGRLAEERGTSRMPRIHTVTLYDRKQP